MRTHLAHSLSNRRGFVVAVSLATCCFLAVVNGASGTVPKAAAVSDCDSNAVIYCGTSSTAKFIEVLRANKDGKGHRDLQTIYKYFNLDPSEYDHFAQTARSGKVYRDGKVIVDGQVVAERAMSYGRSQAVHSGTGLVTRQISGTTLYGNYTARTYAAGTDSIPAMVSFDENGMAETIVLTSCGNPVSARITKTRAACDMLQKTPVTGKPNTYKFTAKASVVGHAKITKYVYSFSDGSPDVVKTNGTDPVEHVFKTGNTTVKVTVFAAVPGKQEISRTSTTCQTVVTVTQPLAQCELLEAAPLSGTKRSYRFTAKAKYDAGATLTGANFEFGDGQSAASVAPATTTQVATTHEYVKAGDYTITAHLLYSVYGEPVTALSCKTSITVRDTPPPPPPPQPFYECVELRVIEAKERTRTFVATTKYGNGAVLTGADFDFGDGKKATGVQPLNPMTVQVSHTYEGDSEYSVAAVLHFTIDGKPVTGKLCSTKTTVTTPFYQCVDLKGPEPVGQTYKFVATAYYGNGATFSGADFDFGDGQVAKNVAPSSSNEVAVSHTYQPGKQYSVSAILRFTVNGIGVSAPACRAVVEPDTPPVPECKPGIPVGDERCQPCKYDASISASDKERCVAPPAATLPNTGAGSAAALSAVGLIGGFLLYRHMLFQRHKRAFTAAMNGTSPLPLGQPLDPDRPLSGTPYSAPAAALRRRTFRRRQF